MELRSAITHILIYYLETAAAPVGWNKLSPELKLMVFKELSDLDIGVERPTQSHKFFYRDHAADPALKVWDQMVRYFLVCRSWNADLHVTLVEGDSIHTILDFAPHDMCVAAIQRLIRTTPTAIPHDRLEHLARSAIWRNFPRCVEMVLCQMNGGIPDVSLLWAAVIKQSMTVIRLLLARGVPTGFSWVSYGTWTPNTPLAIAVNNGNLAIARELLEAGASPMFHVDLYDALQHVSRIGGDGAMIYLLARYGLGMDDRHYARYSERNDWAGNASEEYDPMDDDIYYMWCATRHPLEIAVEVDAVSAAEALLSYDNFLLLDIARAYKEAMSDEMRVLLLRYMHRAFAHLPKWHDVGGAPGDRTVF
ncbi:hypothetical protein BJY00DRAFT_319402 [Aspergillus carlsbadensis]|nr:hypothetical protein BJY00DRAFT_319402 [Aspergillus carlsbadensis]